jgi:hypothetical protein
MAAEESEWTIEKSIAVLKACNGDQRTEDDLFSTDFLHPTISGGTVDLAAGIKAYHAKHAKED